MSEIKIFNNSCIEIDSIHDLSRVDILKILERNTFVGIRGLFSPKELKSSLSLIEKKIHTQEVYPAVGNHNSLVQKNHQKIVIGGGSQRSYYVPRCLRVVYNPIWSENIFKMRKHFKLLAAVRNKILGKPLSYAISKIESDGFWTASRLQHYPSGGGFFYRHKDLVVEKSNLEGGLEKFLQIILLITQKGKDFKNGGAFIETDGRYLNLEDFYGSGDILIYDGRTVHGVDDIDPGKLLNFSKVTGRVVAMASLYADFTKKNKTS